MATVFKKPVTINAPDKDVIINGMDFTEEALLTFTAAKSITVKNCRFYNLKPNAVKTMMIIGSANPVKVVIENCFFGNNPAIDKNLMYHVVEGNFTLATGSSFSNNYFKSGACTHNAISIYNVEDNAVIACNNNYFEYSGCGFRVGIKGAAKCTINMRGNTYKTTDPSSGYEYAGLLTIQPYAKETTSFNDVVIKMADTRNLTDRKQVVMLYANKTDTPFDKSTNYPKVYINDVLQTDIPAVGGTVVNDSSASE